MEHKRIILIVLDGVGCGYSPDAELFFDVGADTLGTVFKHFPNINIPTLIKLGLLNIRNDYNQEKHVLSDVTGGYGRLKELSLGKDTTIGHWEIAGIITPKPFPTYPNGFPEEIIEEISKKTGCGLMGNMVASGTEIIKKLGQEHQKTRKLIVYTSADSVFQIAAHEDVFNIDELYKACKAAREVLHGEHAVARVIARPFTGRYPNYTRTSLRKDFSLIPPKYNMLNIIKDAALESVGIGKIEDIFASTGITRSIHSHGNKECCDSLIKELPKSYKGLLFVNLVDFDMKYGHRNDIKGFKEELERTDLYLKVVMDEMKEDDLLIITADHGCDPGFKGTDHTREYVPLLIYKKDMKEGINLGTRAGFNNIAVTCLDYLGLEHTITGESFLDSLA